MVPAASSGILFTEIVYHTGEIELNWETGTVYSTVCFRFVKVVTRSMCNNVWSKAPVIYTHACQIPHIRIWQVLPTLKEIKIGMRSSLHKLQEPVLFSSHSPYFILQETKEVFASSPQRIRGGVLSHLREDLYMVSTSCSGKRAAGGGWCKHRWFLCVSNSAALRLHSEYQLTVPNLRALFMNSQTFKGRCLRFVSEYNGSLNGWIKPRQECVFVMIK